MNTQYYRPIILTILLFLPAAIGYGQPWSQLQTLTHQNQVSLDKFGFSVGIDGRWAVVGAPFNDAGGSAFNGDGSAFIYRHDPSLGWMEAQELYINHPNSLPRFGWAVSLDTTWILVTAYTDAYDATGGNEMNAAGAAYLYTRNASGQWMTHQKLVASDRHPDDYFGWSASLSGDYLIIGARYETDDASGNDSLSGAGSAYIFERNAGNTWIQKQKLVASDRQAEDAFGISVDIDGEYAIVGAYLEDHNASGADSLDMAGAAYVFKRGSNGIWTEVCKLVSPDRGQWEYFGCQVAIDDSTALIGAYGDGQDASGGNPMMSAGAAYIARMNSNGAWTIVQKLVASDREMADAFGNSVALYRSRAVIGAHWDNPAGTALNQRHGSAYVFEPGVTGTWIEKAKLTASDAADPDRFGTSVAAWDSLILVGAPYRQAETGAAYLFEGSTMMGLEQQAIQALAIYPNPARDEIRFSGLPYGPYHLEVRDLTGRRLIVAHDVDSKLSFSLPGLHPGIYLVSLRNASVTYTGKLIIEGE